MVCQRCGSTRVLYACGHCIDSFYAKLDGVEYDGYVPTKLGIGRFSDDMEIKVCMDCGQLQGTWPNHGCFPTRRED